MGVSPFVLRPFSVPASQFSSQSHFSVLQINSNPQNSSEEETTEVLDGSEDTVYYVSAFSVPVLDGLVKVPNQIRQRQLSKHSLSSILVF